MQGPLGVVLTSSSVGCVAAPPSFHFASWRNMLMFFVQVPGLAEGKPSLLVGDQAYVRVESVGGQQQIKYDRKEYQGYIHVVERDRILLKFSPRYSQQKFCSLFT